MSVVASSRALPSATSPTAVHVVPPSVEYSHVPLPVMAWIAIPSAAPVSTSAIDAPTIADTKSPALVASSVVPVSDGVAAITLNRPDRLNALTTQLTREMLDALMEYARWRQPVVVAALAMAGLTAPVTLAGLLAMQNAEILAGLTLAQLVRPGAPIIYGSTSSPMDMRTGGLSIGAPELSMIVSCTAQMARFYQLPSRSGGGLTDANFPDAQAGIQSAMALITAARNGINFILHACGILSAYVAMSYEKFMIDEELCGITKKLIEPI